MHDRRAGGGGTDDEPVGGQAGTCWRISGIFDMLLALVLFPGIDCVDDGGVTKV